jgi:hypothetical protein
MPRSLLRGALFDLAILKDVAQLIHLFLSSLQNWDLFEEGLLNIYSFLETPVYCGIGRKPDPLLVPCSNRKYAKVCKKRKNGRLVEIIQSMSMDFSGL